MTSTSAQKSNFTGATGTNYPHKAAPGGCGALDNPFGCMSNRRASTYTFSHDDFGPQLPRNALRNARIPLRKWCVRLAPTVQPPLPGLNAERCGARAPPCRIETGRHLGQRDKLHTRILGGCAGGKHALSARLRQRPPPFGASSFCASPAPRSCGAGEVDERMPRRDADVSGRGTLFRKRQSTRHQMA